jgi:hypothetical protein
MPGRRREIAGRPFVHIDDYAQWKGRHVPRGYLIEEARHVGISVRGWNSWIGEYARDGKVDLFGLILTEVESPLHLREGESIATHPTMEQAERALERRAEVICRLVRLAGYQPASSGQEASVRGRERRILQALVDVGPMGGADLAAYVGCGRRTLYNPGGLKDLIDRGFVTHEERNAFAATDAGRCALNAK